MAQGEFTKEEAAETIKAMDEVFNALPKSKKAEFIGHYNDICLFMAAAQRAAPAEGRLVPHHGTGP